MRKSKKILKDEIKLNKENIDASAQAVKSTVVKCVSAAVCTGIVCYSAEICTEKVVSASQQLSESGNSTTASETLPEVTTAIDFTSKSSTTVDNSSSTQSSSVSEQSATVNSTTEEATTVTTKKSLTTAEIVAKYNNAVNKVKSGSKSIKQNYSENTQISTPDISNSTVKSIADKLIDANMGKNKENVTYTSIEDKKNNFPVAGQSYASKLTENDVQSAKMATSGNESIIMIKVKNDTVPNTGTYNGKAFSLVTKNQVIENAGSVGMRFIKEDSIKVTYKNGVIKAKIDERTGNIVAVDYYVEWKLALTTTVGNLDIAIEFGIDDNYTINW